MITELIVVIACTNSSGCAQATSAYYQSHPELKNNVRANTDILKKKIGPGIVALTPAVLLLAKGKATFSLNKYLSLQMSNNENMLLFKISF